MSNLNWHFPATIQEAAQLVKKDGLIPHSGGTGVLLANLHMRNDLIDLSALPLHYSEVKDNSVKIGSMATYADLIDIFSKINPDHIIVKSLQDSANTPLRNRITLGGSIAHFPPWTDLMGALLALETQLNLDGAHCGTFALQKYLARKSLQWNTLITSVEIPLTEWQAYAFRQVQTKNDMPIFHITILLQQDKNKITDSRIIITGNIGRYHRFAKIEDYLNDSNWNEIDPEKIQNMVDVKFAGKKIEDPDYTSHLAAVEISRGIEQLRGQQ